MSPNTVVYVDLARLYFDPLNPRLPKSIDGRDDASVLDYMAKHGNIVELMLSIGEMGFSNAEPLLVVPDQSDYIVVEGNRRLAALKLLNDPLLAKVRVKNINEASQNANHKPTEIPVIVYPQRNDILDYLGYRHITGVKDWGALEKARYLEQLYDLHIDQVGEERIYSTLAKMIGSRSDYVGKLHTALKLYDVANENAYFETDLSEGEIDFSWLYTALSFSAINSFLGLSSPSDSSLESFNKENYEKLFIWLFHPTKKAVKDSRQISDLSKILASPIALQNLEKGKAISEAILYTSAPNETFISFLDQAKHSLKSSKDAIEQLSGMPQDAIELIEEIEKLCKSIRGSLNEVFSNRGADAAPNKYVLEEIIKEMISKQLKED